MDATEGRVVVGVDGTDPSKEALRHGARLAESLAVPLDAVLCWDETLIYDSYRAVDAEDLRRSSEAVLEETLTDVFGDRRPGNLRPRLLRGQVATRLIEESEHALVLVVGRRGGRGVLGRVLGSVSSALVAHARCPVLVVRH